MPITCKLVDGRNVLMHPLPEPIDSPQPTERAGPETTQQSEDHKQEKPQ